MITPTPHPHSPESGDTHNQDVLGTGQTSKGSDDALQTIEEKYNAKVAEIMADSVKRKDERDKRLLEDTQRINAKFEEEMIKRRNEWNNKLAEELKEDEERYEKMQAVSKRRWEKLAEELKESKKKIEKKLQCIIPDSNGEWNNRLAEIEKLDLIILTERIFHSCKVEKISSIDDIDTKSTEKKQIQALESLRNAIKNGDRISCFSHSFFGLRTQKTYMSFRLKGRPPLNFEKEEINTLEKLYKESWSEYDEEWQEYLLAKFRESLENRHEFSVLYFNPKLDNKFPEKPENIIGFMRATPYKSDTDPSAEYLGAVNVSSDYRGFSFMKYMLQEYLERKFYISKEIYIHAVSGSDAEKIWESMGFEKKEIETIPYGTGKEMKGQLMCLTRERYKSLQKKEK